MATKEFGVACYDRAAVNEELFVLRAQDKHAPNVVRYWAYLAAGNPPLDIGLPTFNATASATQPVHKINEALEVANRMEAWPTRKLPD